MIVTVEADSSDFDFVSRFFAPAVGDRVLLGGQAVTVTRGELLRG